MGAKRFACFTFSSLTLQRLLFSHLLRCVLDHLPHTTYHGTVISVGIGSGLAPHMSFLRERVHAASNLGVDVAPYSLYFGNRCVREFLYRDELEHIATEHGDWFTLHTAFSRDGDRRKKKVYVQDLVAVTDDARRLLLERQGMLYVCGNRNLPGPLKESINVCFARGSIDARSLEDATKAVEDLFLHGRVQQEVW